jgi:hypothetical protein
MSSAVGSQRKTQAIAPGQRRGPASGGRGAPAARGGLLRGRGRAAERPSAAAACGRCEKPAAGKLDVPVYLTTEAEWEQEKATIDSWLKP